MQGISAANITKSFSLQTSLRIAMASTLNVDLSTIGTPVATAVATTDRRLTASAAVATTDRRLQATSAADIAFLITLLTTQSSDALTAAITATLQSTSGSSAFQSYAASEGIYGLTVLGATVNDITPTQMPTPMPTGLSILSTGLGSKDLISLTAIAIVGIFVVLGLLGGMVFVRRRMFAKKENPEVDLSDPFAGLGSPAKDEEAPEPPTMPSTRVRRGPIYTVGTRIEANYRGRGKWYSGEITADYGDGTYDISYDDGDAEQGAVEDFIRPPRARRNRINASSAASVNSGFGQQWSNPRFDAGVANIGNGVANTFGLMGSLFSQQPARLTNNPTYDDRSVMSGLSADSGESGLTGFTSASSGIRLAPGTAGTLKRPTKRGPDKLTIDVMQNSDSD